MVSARSLAGAVAALVTIAVAAAGCGGGTGNTSAGSTSGGSTSAATTAPLPTVASPGATTPTTSSDAGALTAEAEQAAAGDIPDNQAFLTYLNPGGGYSIKVPEGWARTGSGRRVTFRDKNNVVRIEVLAGSKATPAAAKAELARTAQRTPSLRFERPTATTARGKTLVKVVYSTASAPSPVTGKRVTLVVHRYYVPGSGKHAVVDLGTPQGVDNVDAYRLMIESFQWR